MNRIEPLVKKNAGEDLIRIITQAFYGNRVATMIRKDRIDSFILGYVDDRFDIMESDKIDRTYIKVPGTDNLVFAYNKYREEECRKDSEQLLKERGRGFKPLAEIPELGIRLYSRCLVFRLGENNEPASLEEGDFKYFIDYLAM